MVRTSRSGADGRSGAVVLWATGPGSRIREWSVESIKLIEAT
jgi:hypothetical protein